MILISDWKAIEQCVYLLRWDLGGHLRSHQEHQKNHDAKLDVTVIACMITLYHLRSCICIASPLAIYDHSNILPYCMLLLVLVSNHWWPVKCPSTQSITHYMVSEARRPESLCTPLTHLTSKTQIIGRSGRDTSSSTTWHLDFQRKVSPDMSDCLWEEAEDILKSANESEDDNVIFKRARLNRWIQYVGGSVENYVTYLHKLVENCAYEDLKSEMICNRLVVESLGHNVGMWGILKLHLGEKHVYWNRPSNTKHLDSLPPCALWFRLHLARINYTVEHVPGRLLYTTNARSSVLGAKGELLHHWPARADLSICEGLLLYGIRIVVPEKLQNKILHKIHQGHQVHREMLTSSDELSVVSKSFCSDGDLATCCSTCAQVHPPPKEPMLPSPFPKHLWEVTTNLLEFKASGTF